MKVKYPVIFLFFLSVVPVHIIKGQEQISRAGTSLNFQVLKTVGDTVSVSQVLNTAMGFKDPEYFVEKTDPKETYWIKVDMSSELENLSTDSIWYLKTTSFAYASLYFNDAGSIVEQNFGRFQQRQEDRGIMSFPGIPFTKEYLIEGRYLFLKIRRVIFFDYPSRWKVLYRSQFQEQLIRQFYSQRDLKTLQPIYIFTGVCLIIFILTVMYFIYSRRLEFLWYAVYVLCLFLYLASDVFRFHELLFGQYGFESYTFFFEMQVAINLFYILFVIRYLETKKNYPKLHIPLKFISYFLMGTLLIDCFLLFTGMFTMHIHLLDIERLVMTIFGLFGMTYLLFRAKNKLAYFVVIGSFCYMFGALSLLFFGNRLYMILGGALEIIVFAAGLTYKIQAEYLERIRFKTEAYENKNKALRAQINPHFVFNALASIQHLVTKNERTTTLKYLSKFSRLMRNILESSIETHVVLSEEIKMLEDYLELESLRFSKKFTYDIFIAPEINPDLVEIPFMLLQPFTENAIIHGLLPKKEANRMVFIRFEKLEDQIICEIEDNGVGRAFSSHNATIRNPDKKSRGLEVTRQRIENMGYSTKPIQIIDKMDASGLPSGTKVVINIPVKE